MLSDVFLEMTSYTKVPFSILAPSHFPKFSHFNFHNWLSFIMILMLCIHINFFSRRLPSSPPLNTFYAQVYISYVSNYEAASSLCTQLRKKNEAFAKWEQEALATIPGGHKFIGFLLVILFFLFACTHAHTHLYICLHTPSPTHAFIHNTSYIHLYTHTSLHALAFIHPNFQPINHVLPFIPRSLPYRESPVTSSWWSNSSKRLGKITRTSRLSVTHSHLLRRLPVWSIGERKRRRDCNVFPRLRRVYPGNSKRCVSQIGDLWWKGNWTSWRRER